MIRDFEITVLNENSSNNPKLQSEHGLALFFYIDGEKYLFDTGASDIFTKNADELGIDLTELKGVFLSHAHYDHTGGLSELNDTDVYIHKNFFHPKYKLDGGEYEYIGLQHNREFYEKNGLNFKEVDGLLELAKGVTLIGNLKKEPQPPYFFIKKENEYVQDYFDDELVLTLNTEKGLIIITGCSHSGIINIIESATYINRPKKIYALFGGFHLSSLSDCEVQQVASKINDYRIENIGISHCTGDKLTKHINGNVFDFSVADVFKR
jgi:7,8-dihydropterin-6-yl-methyl-4-(beta-D-ribofuranosyl)aminobenzene 5'-phosphate synthase